MPITPERSLAFYRGCRDGEFQAADQVLIRGTFDSGDLKEVGKRRAMELLRFSNNLHKERRFLARCGGTNRDYHSSPSRGRRPLRSSRAASAECDALRLQSDSIVHRVPEPLLAANVPLCGLNAFVLSWPSRYWIRSISPPASWQSRAHVRTSLSLGGGRTGADPVPPRTCKRADD